MLTQKRLKELLSYHPETGVFIWRVNKSGSARRGQMAGTTDPNGYIKIIVDKEQYLAHRLAFLYMLGEWPDDNVLHGDKGPSCNAMSNLRIGTSTENNRDAAMRWDNTTGVTGVYWNKRENKWMARIMVSGKNKSKLFESKEDAISQRKEWEQLNGFTERHGMEKQTRAHKLEARIAKLEGQIAGNKQLLHEQLQIIKEYEAESRRQIEQNGGRRSNEA